MSGFKDMVAADSRQIFLNCDEFAESRTIVYDEIPYANIPVVLSSVKEKNRRQLVSDHVQGLYLVSAVLHCAATDLDGMVPEKGQRIKISDEDCSGFFREFYVASSTCEFGMIRAELEAIDE